MNQGALNHRCHKGKILTPTSLDNCQGIVNVSSGVCYVWLRHWTSGFFPWDYHPSLYYLQWISWSTLWSYNRSKGWRQGHSRVACCFGVLLRVIREEHGLVCGDTWSNDPSTSNVAYRGISTQSRLKWLFSSGKKAIWSVFSCNHTSEGSTCKQYKILYY